MSTLEQWLKERDNGERDFVLVDVREPNEYEINKIPGAVLIPKGEFLTGKALGQLPADKQVVLHCKSGVRSAEALAASRAPASPTRCTSGAAWSPGSTRSTRRSRRTDAPDMTTPPTLRSGASSCVPGVSPRGWSPRR